MVINQLDRHAMEAALKLAGEVGAEVTAISMGPPPAAAVLKECLAMGAGRAVLLSDRSFAGADAYATAYTLAKGIEVDGMPDLVVCGMSSSDGSTEWVAPELSVFLDCPVVTGVIGLEATGNAGLKVSARLDNGYRVVKVNGGPVVLAVTRELNTPRNISFSGIIKARKKEVAIWNLERLGIAAAAVGQDGSPTIISGMRVAESTRKVQMIEGTREAKAEELVRLLAAAGVL
ncbi:MAG: electron transfer flavoprotein subunit beta/FixA family protein [Deltaproteobacteria bacterium]|nr:electron transfer flavoprotein subunit beta/FixA family protein [Candidatus Anaeroferrophillacea bacterium]